MNRDRARDPAAAAALAVLSAVTALAFDRVFRDGAYLLPVLGAALLPHAIGWFGRRRQWPAVAPILLSVLALALYATWTAAWSTTFLGLPGTETPDALGTTLRDGWELLRTGVAPVAATTEGVLLTVVALWVMATTADALAFDGEAPLGAIVPSLVIFVVASSLGPDEFSVWSTGLYLAGAAGFLAVGHRELLEQRRSWFTGRGAGNGGLSPLRAGAGLAAIAILVGVFVAPELPGADGGPLIDYKSGTGRGSAAYQSSENPLVDLAARVSAATNEELFTVDAPTHLYWRQVALDEFDGTQWTLESNSQAASNVLDGAETGSRIVRQRFRLSRITERWLPAAYEPVSISIPDARILPESRTLFNADGAVIGLEYDVVSRVPPEVPTAEQIEATAGAPPDGLAPFLELPGDFPAEVRRTARRVTEGSATQYDAALALQTFFTDGSFTYDLDVPVGSSNDAMSEFLESRRGFCQQFAGTYAAMARSVGLASRVVVGFNPGDYDADADLFRVTDADLHAWAEVWLAGLGWTLFEPTPAGSQPGATDPNVGEPAGAVATDPTATTTTTVAPAPTTPTTAVPPAGGQAGRVTVDVEAPGSDATPSRVRWILLGLVAAVLVFLAVRVGGIWVRRTRRRSRRRRGPPRAAVVGAWSEALDRLGEHGLPATRSDTPREVVGATASRPRPEPDARVPLSRLANATSVALWSAAEPAPADADQAWRDLAEVERALRAGTPRATRIRRSITRNFAAPVEEDQRAN